MRVSRIYIRIEMLDGTKGNQTHSHCIEYERGRRKSTRDVFNAFYFEFRVACLCCLFKVLCVVFSIWERGNTAQQSEAAKRNREKRKKITTTTATATYIKRKRMKKEEKKYRARDKSNRNVENNTQCSELCL